jgi:hypothetical protein
MNTQRILPHVLVAAQFLLAAVTLSWAFGASADKFTGVSAGVFGKERPYMTAVCNRQFYVWERPELPITELLPLPPPNAGSIRIAEPVPDTVEVIATEYYRGGSIRDAVVLLANGDIYWFQISTFRKRPSHWVYAGNLIGSRSRASMDSLRKVTEPR